MHNKINKAFADAFDYLKKIEKYEKQVLNINNPEITEFYDYLKDAFYNGQSFWHLSMNLSWLENMILINEKIELLKQRIIEYFNINKEVEDPSEFNNYLKVLWYIKSLDRLCSIRDIIELIDSNQIETIIDIIEEEVEDISYDKLDDEILQLNLEK